MKTLLILSCVFLCLTIVGKSHAATRVFLEDCEATSYSQHFLERSYGTSVLEYWNDMKSSMSRSTDAHSGTYSMHYDAFNCLGTGSCNPHTNVGLGGATYGNTSGFDLSTVNARIWYVRWYQKWASGITWGSTAGVKIIYVNYADSGDFTLFIGKWSNTAFMLSLINNNGYVSALPQHDNWFSSPSNTDDNAWHLFEIYLDVGTTNGANGSLWVKIDGVQEFSANSITYNNSQVHSNPIHHFTGWPSNYSGTTGVTCNTWLDDLEIWIDGVPGVTTTTTNPTTSTTTVPTTSTTTHPTTTTTLASATSTTTTVPTTTTTQPTTTTTTTTTVPTTTTTQPTTTTTTTLTVSTTTTTTTLPTGTTMSWSAVQQAGNTSWDDSGVTWCLRVLIQGTSVTTSGNQIVLGFKGKISDVDSYQIRKVSIAQRDTSGPEGKVLESTWTKVTFDGHSSDTWATDVATVPYGTEKLSNSISFPLQAGTDYYVTYLLVTPSVYLMTPGGYRELYFSGADHTDDIDWVGNGYSAYNQRIHAISSINVITGAAPGKPGKPILVQ